MKPAPQKDIYDFPTYYYLPWRLAWGFPLIGGGLELIILGRPVFGSIVILLGILSLTARYGIKIDLSKKTYSDYISILWIRNGEDIAYSEIDYVFIKNSTQSQTMNSMVTSSTFKKQLFDVYLKFDGDEKVFLLSEEKKKNALAFAGNLAQELNVEVLDHTQAPPSIS